MATDTLLPRDVAILRYIARYRIGLRSVLGRLFFEGGDPGRVLGLLQKRGLITIHSKALPQNSSYVTLTAAGYAAIGMKLNKRACQAIGPSALNKAIAISVGCTYGTSTRHRLTRPELVRAIGSEAPPDNVFHLASDELGWRAIVRVVFATSADQRQLDRLKRHAEEAKKNDAVRLWLDAGDYGFIVLVPWSDKLAAMRSLIAASPLSSQYVFVVDIGPTVATLERVLRTKTQ